MRGQFSKIANQIVSLLLIAGIVLLFAKTPLYERVKSAFFQKVVPCQKPITYSIGQFDTQFGISQEEFLSDVEQAEKIWESPLQKELFSYDPTGKGSMKVNLVYDYRQQATEKLNDLGITLNGDQKSYNALKNKYESLYSQYVQQKAALDSHYASFKQKEDSYNATVQRWNNQGGAPSGQAEKLNAQKKALDAEAAQIKTQQDDLNTLVADINTIASTLNQLAAELNLKARTYNQIGAEAGTEFEEGLYKSDASGQQIDIYQYDNKTKLIRVLAHELGHSLGMEHVEDPNAIMYKLNEGANSNLTQSDLSELKRVCRVQ